MDHVIELGQYERHLKSRGLRPATLTAYLGWVRRLDQALGVPLEAATTADLEGWVADHDWAPNSHQKAVQAVQYFYRWAHESGHIPTDPAVTLRPARTPTAIPNPCPEDVYAGAVQAASGVTYWRLRLAAETGLRRAELAAVNSRDVHMHQAGPALRVVGKGGRARWVPLPTDLAGWLADQHGWAFPSGQRKGEHMTAASVGRWFYRQLGVKAHSLRHRYATIAYRNGRDINAVKQLLGHSSVATTQIYVAVADQDMIDAASWAWQATPTKTNQVRGTA